MKISIIMIACDEADWPRRTIENLRHTHDNLEIVLVDDGSTDVCCHDVGADIVVRHETRLGVVPSRRAGVQAASGDVFTFLDAHHFASPGCFDQCAELAIREQAIVYPCVGGLDEQRRRYHRTEHDRWIGHGCVLRIRNDSDSPGLFKGAWIRREPGATVSPIQAMVVPGYTVPRSVYDRIPLPESMTGWGASEPALTIQAFMAGVPLLHLCGPLCRHWFCPRGTRSFLRPRWMEIRNHAIVARICFEEETWDTFWWPEVFARYVRVFDAREIEDDPAVLDHRDRLQAITVRRDEEFFKEILRRELPQCSSA